MKAHLLYSDRDLAADATLPPHAADVIQDLELHTVIRSMGAGDEYLTAVAQQVLLSSLIEPDHIRYRQEILRDCRRNPDILRDLYSTAVSAIEADKKIFRGIFQDRPTEVLRRSIEVLRSLESPLRRLQQVATEYGAQFDSPGLDTFFATLRTELDEDYFAAVDQHLKRLQFRGGIVISARLGVGNRGVDYRLRTPLQKTQSFTDLFGLGERSAFSFEIAARDEAGADAVAELTDRGLDTVAEALTQSTDHILGFFKALRFELGFYVGCLNLEDQLLDRGEAVCVPTPVPWRDRTLRFDGVYDPSLALTAAAGSVTGNDLDASDRMLLMITGANSGGKSTFLRSVGTAQLMMQSGMFVAATSFCASVCDNVFTHFAREEDTTMASGRLDEELGRMNTIADAVTAHSLVLFNESFASTNEREGSEIAREIVRALIESDVRIVFVTHLFDLADGLYRRELTTALFLRAERQPDGHRNYRLSEGAPLSTSFGEDLYRNIGGWGRSVPHPLSEPTPPNSAYEARQ